MNYCLWVYFVSISIYQGLTQKNDGNIKELYNEEGNKKKTQSNTKPQQQKKPKSAPLKTKKSKKS